MVLNVGVVDSTESLLKELQQELVFKINSYAPIDEIKLVLANGGRRLMTSAPVFAGAQQKSAICNQSTNNRKDYFFNQVEHYDGSLALGGYYSCFPFRNQVDESITSGLTPLHYACRNNYFEAAQLFLIRGANVSAADNAGYTPLHLCAERGRYRIMKLLVEYMAEVSHSLARKDVTHPLRERVEEPLRLAIKNDHYECAQFLLENGANPNTRYFEGTELCLVQPEEVSFISLLLSYGADPNVYDRDGLTPLMRACRKGERGISAARILIENGADVNALAMPKQDLRTPLHYAALYGSTSLVRLLIEKGAMVNQPKGYDKPSVLDLAVLKDDPEMVHILLKAGAKPNAVHTYIGSALHLAASSNLQNQYEIMRLLLKHGADVNLSHSFPEGGILRSPLAEYFKTQHTIDKKIVYLLLCYGGQIIMRSPFADARGQLCNILRVHGIQTDIFDIMMDLGEQYDRTSIERMCFPETLKKLMLSKASQPPSLQQLCRLKIRHYLKPMCAEKVAALVVPRHLIPYLLGLQL